MPERSEISYNLVRTQWERDMVFMVSGDRVPATWTLGMHKTHVARTWFEKDAAMTF